MSASSSHCCTSILFCSSQTNASSHAALSFCANVRNVVMREAWPARQLKKKNVCAQDRTAEVKISLAIIVLIILLANQRYDTIHNWPMTAWLHWWFSFVETTLIVFFSYVHLFSNIPSNENDFSICTGFASDRIGRVYVHSGGPDFLS